MDFDYRNKPHPMLREYEAKETAISIEYDAARRLKMQRAELEVRIKKIDALLNILEKHPELEQASNLMRELL